MIFFDNLHTLLMSLHDYCLKLSALVPFYSSRATIVRARFFLASALLTKKYLYTRSDGRSVLKKNDSFTFRCVNSCLHENGTFLAFCNSKYLRILKTIIFFPIYIGHLNYLEKRKKRKNLDRERKQYTFHFLRLRH